MSEIHSRFQGLTPFSLYINTALYSWIFLFRGIHSEPNCVACIHMTYKHKNSFARANKFNCLFIDCQHSSFQFQRVTLNTWPLFHFTHIFFLVSVFILFLCWVCITVLYWVELDLIRCINRSFQIITFWKPKRKIRHWNVKHLNYNHLRKITSKYQIPRSIYRWNCLICVQ